MSSFSAPENIKEIKLWRTNISENTTHHTFVLNLDSNTFISQHHLPTSKNNNLLSIFYTLFLIFTLALFYVRIFVPYYIWYRKSRISKMFVRKKQLMNVGFVFKSVRDVWNVIHSQLQFLLNLKHGTNLIIFSKILNIHLCS